MVEDYGEGVRLDADGVPMLPGYTNGACMTQAISNLPLGISVSKKVVVEAVDRVEAAAVEMKDLALANDSGKDVGGVCCIVCLLQDIKGRLCGWARGAPDTSMKMM